jgi:hypothetical protein
MTGLPFATCAGRPIRFPHWHLRLTLLIVTALPAITQRVSGQVILTPEGPKSVAPADQQSTAAADRDRHQHHQLSVSPAGEPQPALRYRLWIPQHQREPGDAASFYYRAIVLYEQFPARQQVDDLLDTPLDQLPANPEPLQGAFANIYTTLVEATSREQCDWGWQLSNIQGTELYSFLLPEVQSMRGIGKLLALKIRVAIRDGDYDQAVVDLRMGYRIAHDCAQQPFLINGLVGIAIASILNEQVVLLIDAPDSPNLYWALTSLPDPLIDLRPATLFESEAVFRAFPLLKDPLEQQRTEAGWIRAWSDTVHEFYQLAGGGDQFPQPMGPLAGAAIILRAYPAAMRALQDQGMDQATLKAMPPGQVVAVYQSRYARQLADEMQKWAMVPYFQRKGRADDVLQAHSSAISSGEVKEPIPIVSMLMPAMSAVDQAQVRLQAQFAVLRTIEAIRWHASATGRLPDSLEAIREAPVPENPFTGQPFELQVTQDGVTVGFATPADYQWSVRVRLDDSR